MIFSANDVWLTSRRIDGQFPNYKQLLPETFEIEIATPRAALLDVVRRAGLMAQRNAPLRLRFADGELTVSAQTQDIGEATESLPDRLRGRGARDRLQPRLPARRPRGRRGGHRPAQAHQPPPARAHRGTRRELLVPDHAHPPRGLIVREVTLRDFRSYDALELELVPGVVLLHGANGAGKTNLLEALHVGTQGFSPRARRDVQMIRFGADAAGSRSRVPAATNAFETDTLLARRRAASRQAQRRAARLRGAAPPRADDARLHAGPAGGREGRSRHPPRLSRPRRRAPVCPRVRTSRTSTRRRSVSETRRCVGSATVIRRATRSHRGRNGSCTR